METKTLFFAALATFGHARADVGVGVELGFLNRYVDFGVDVEPGTRFLRVGVGTELHGFDLGLDAFQALGSGDYNEISLGLSRDFEFGDLTLTPGFTWFWFPDDSDDTAEISLGFSLPLVPPLEFIGEASFDVFDSVGFLEVGLALPRTLPVGGVEVEVTPSVTFGFDYGMVSGERSFKDNNVVVSLEVSAPVHEQVEVFASINQSYPLGALDDEDVGDVSWFGIGIALGF